MNRHKGVAAVLPCGTLATLAGPPFVTDGPEPVGYRHWELYLASQHVKTADRWSGTAPHVEVNYGAVPNPQLHLIAPLAYDAPPGEVHHYGYGDTELGCKVRVIQETEWLPQVGIFPLLEVPTGQADLGLGSGHVNAFLPVWLQKSWGAQGREWTAYGGGYGTNPGAGKRDWGFAGLLLQCQVYVAYRLTFGP